MLIADQIKERSIAEYLLYMWQTEDLIRAYGRDIERIDKEYISSFGVDDATRTEMREWYESLIMMMEMENVRQSGHLQINRNTIIRLADLHQQLLKSPKHPEYGAEFYRTLPYIVELRAKSGEARAGEIETCFNALYGVLMLRLQHRQVSEGTQQASTQISRFLAMLSAYYKENEREPIFSHDDEER